MAAPSKTARQAMNAGATVREKKVISDEEYVKNLRYDVSNGIHATQEGAKALLRSYDALLPINAELVTARAAAADEKALRLQLEISLQAALDDNAKLREELTLAQTALRAVKNDLSRVQFPDTTGQ